MHLHDPSPIPSPPSAHAKKNHRILVVDDTEAIHRDFKKILGGDDSNADFDAEEAALFGDEASAPRRVAFEMSFALQGAEALELVKAAVHAGRRYSVVFTDVRMPPGWDGLETAAKLWEVDPDLQVVICTAYSDKSWEEMMEKLGNPERVIILKKPFDTIEVLQLAHALTEKWSLLQASRRNMEELEHTVNLRTQQLQAAHHELSQARDVALESTRIKSRFLANMSHEIRTPMNGVIGVANLLMDTPLTGEQREFAETIRFSAEGLLTIINDILDISKIEAGKMAFEEADFSLYDVLEGTLDLLAERAQTKKVELVGFIEPTAPTKLRGDAGRIRQVLTNLVSNAIKFTQAGEVSVRVSRQAESADHCTLDFRVSDTGIGIGPAAQGTLFEAFNQADASTTRQFGGTGLGLAISKQLVEKMGGEIGLESVPGKGSTFWFRLPFQKQEALSAIPGSDHGLVGARILIVDDNATSSRFLHEQIVAWKMRGGAVGAGAEALDRLRQAVREGDPYALAIIDMGMPGGDGLTLARTIAADPRIAGVRLILLTDFGKRIAREELCAAGISDCCFKPVRQSSLFDCLANVLLKQPAPGRPEPDVSPVVSSSRKERILIAEDNAINQRVALGQLRKLGYEADTVANGFEALQALSHTLYDIVLMDCHMPEMDGYEATAAIRQCENGGRHTWIIAMTANAVTGDREECLAAGMDDYVSKPVRLKDLGDALDRARRHTALQMEECAIDPQNIAELDTLLNEDGGSPLPEIIRLFLQDSPAMIARLRAALRSCDAEAIAQIAHAFGGSSSQFGARRLQDLCAKLDKTGRVGNLQSADALIASIEGELHRVVSALEPELRRRELIAPFPVRNLNSQTGNAFTYHSRGVSKGADSSYSTV